ncbi:MAG TPA: twin-arginine translocation signal domain-containing protein [Armatimonadota bacterium]|nr:twin-arginine translocation signal domain-containing protein [Armatimonadota bacterium]
MDRRRFVKQTGAIAGAAAVSGLPLAAQERERKMADGDRITVTANYYEQFDADYSLDVPAEGYGGWQKGEIDISASRTAVAVMHAWDCGTLEKFPGVWRSCAYIPKSIEISKRVFPPLLKAVRDSPLDLVHVVGGGDYYSDVPGYKRLKRLAGDPPDPPERIEGDDVLSELHGFKSRNVWRGEHNTKDRASLAEEMDFLPESRPLDGEPVAENSHQLLAACRKLGVNHLIYAGFAIDACLLTSPGGMVDMSRSGVMCSAIRQATVAVESKESARTEFAKEIALWRVAVSYGFVFDVDDLIAAIA